MRDSKHASGKHRWLRKPMLALATVSALAAAPASAASGTAIADATSDSTVELSSAYPFSETLQRLTAAIEGAGLTVFARIDHQAAAAQVGLVMPPTTVIIYGNPKGGTPVMLLAPQLALDLPLRVLIREGKEGRTLVAFHPAREMMRAADLPDALLAPLNKAEGLIAAAVQP